MHLWAALLAISAMAPVDDDPRERLRAREERSEERPHLGERWRELQKARRELRTASRRVSTAARVPGEAWVNVGPVTQAYGYNGVRYTRIDSGRARHAVVHPTNPNIVYLATSGR